MTMPAPTTGDRPVATPTGQHWRYLVAECESCGLLVYTVLVVRRDGSEGPGTRWRHLDSPPYEACNPGSVALHRRLSAQAAVDE